MEFVHLKKGIFISFEGGEGSGKTTMIALIKQSLEESRIKTLVTREPGGIAISEQIRGILLDSNNGLMDGRTEALLYAAARRQHLVERVVPALESGFVVLCDRFIDSSLAYQGYARGIGIAEVLSVNSFAIDHVMPQLTFYFDVDPQVGLERIKGNISREINRLDLESIDFHQKVREGYKVVCAMYPERIVAVDANRSVDEVLKDIKKLLQPFLQDL